MTGAALEIALSYLVERMRDLSLFSLHTRAKGREYWNSLLI